MLPLKRFTDQSCPCQGIAIQCIQCIRYTQEVKTACEQSKHTRTYTHTYVRTYIRTHAHLYQSNCPKLDTRKHCPLKPLRK